MSEEDVREIASRVADKTHSFCWMRHIFPSWTPAGTRCPFWILGNVALLRSMTKDYALTALRLGYMLAPPEVVERVRAQQYSWSVNALAQAAGIAALADTAHVEDGRRRSTGRQALPHRRA